MLAHKWTAPIIRCLVDGGKRPSEFMALIEGISQKMLIQTLRQMEQYGLVTRKVHAVVPPRVDYLLTPLGLSLTEALKILWRWSQDHHAEIAALETRRRPPTRRDSPKLPILRKETQRRRGR